MVAHSSAPRIRGITSKGHGRSTDVSSSYVRKVSPTDRTSSSASRWRSSSAPVPSRARWSHRGSAIGRGRPSASTNSS
jgi:hypothetical protein